MKKILAVFTVLLTVFLAFKLSSGNIVKAESGNSPKIKLEVQFLEEGTDKLLAESVHLEGDQGVFKSIEVPLQIRDEYTIVSQGFDESSTALINQGDVYNKNLIYQIRFKKVTKTPEVPQVGPYTLKVSEFDESGKNYQINYPGALDIQNKPIKQGANQSTDFATTFGYFEIDEDGSLVWCYDPSLPVRNGAKYERKVIDENIDAALIQNFGLGYFDNEKSYLLASTQQKMLWELLGNKFPNEPYLIERDKDSDGNYYNSKLRPLSDDEKNRVKQFKNKINELVELYKSTKLPNYKLLNNDVAILKEDNIIEVKYTENDRVVKLSGDDDYTKKLIEAFKNGTIKAKNGFSVSINEENEISITIPKDVKTGEYEIVDFSLIRPEYTGESYAYSSNYGYQPLQINRLLKPKMFTLKVNISEKSKPKEEEPKIPENPKPKEEKPRIPEDPKPREEKPRIPKEPKEEPKVPEEPKKEEEKTSEKTKPKKDNELPNTGTKEEISMTVLAILVLVSSIGFSFYKKEMI